MTQFSITQEQRGTTLGSIEKPAGDESKTTMSQYINPNLIKNLHFNSPNSTARDRFATTNVGYTTAVKYKPKYEYIRKVGEDKFHREKMREIVLGSDFEVGFDSKPNCPSNQHMIEEGKPMFEPPIFYNTKDMEENKTLVEKQNFTIATGIKGGKDAEQEIWLNPF